MNTFTFPRAIPFLLGLLALTGCGDSWTFNQKVTITVETPSGPKSASSVMEATLIDTDIPLTVPEARGAKLEIEGEGVVLELAPGKYVFVLRRDLPSAYELLLPNVAPVDAAATLEQSTEPISATIPEDKYPVMVTFSDIHDPKSIKRIYPNDFEDVFGHGHKLTSIILSTTREPITTGRMNSLLSWIGDDGIDPSKNEGRKYTLHYPNASPRGYGTLSLSDFIGRY